MRVGVCLSRRDFFYDIHSLVKSFFPDDEVRIFDLSDEEKCAETDDLLIRLDVPEGEDRKRIRDELKRAVYRTMCDYTGHSLPWGTLSGIRPTKIPMALLEAGKSEAEAADFMVREHLVSPEKARLAAEIASLERTIVQELGLGPDSYSVYVHVPFCPSICLYCTFSSTPAASFERDMDRYIDEVILEMRERRAELEEKGITGPPTTVYVGGGTPTALSPARLDRLLAGISEIWDSASAREFTVEAGRPDSITKEHLLVMKRRGVTRISVNPQTMNAETLSVIGRDHTPEDTVRAFRMAREAGFDNINMDLILGLPGEGEEELARTLTAVAALRPDSLTVHSLAVKRASRLRRTIIEDRERDPGADRGSFGGLIMSRSESLMERASATALGLGMRPYYLYRQKNLAGNLENTGFALPGRACLYNILIMEELQTIYAFGAGASTKLVFPDGRIERTVSPKDVKLWLSRREEKRHAADC